MPDDDRGSISRWLLIVKASDDRAVVDAAVRALWERYFDRLVRLARERQRTPRNGTREEEDVALSAIMSFCTRAAAGKFPRLDDRYDLWRILVTIASRKVARLRGRRRPTRSDVDLLDQVVGREPSPELAAMVTEELGRLLAALPNDSYRTIASMKLEGFTNDEIAHRLGCCTKNVEYKLRNIRATWLPLHREEAAAARPEG
jgi:DNA-directed RNA polymerase specialized sigma24 family protein